MRAMSLPHNLQGRLVFERLKGLKSKGVKLRLAVNAPQTSREDTAELAAAGTSSARDVELVVCRVRREMCVKTHSFRMGCTNTD